MLEDFDVGAFNRAAPFPFKSYTSMVEPAAFEELNNNFPAIDLFRYVVGTDRGTQMPHTRHMIFLDAPLFGRKFNRRGWYTDAARLPPVWQSFVEEIRASEAYRKFVCRLFGVKKFAIRFEWHLLARDTYICPHLDASWRIGDHLFYFHDKMEWRNEWGGNLELLAPPPSALKNPGFEDFSQRVSVSPNGIQGVLIKNSPIAWHGVSNITCPEGMFRRVFLVNLGYTFQFAVTRLRRGLRQKFRGGF